MHRIILIFYLLHGSSFHRSRFPFSHVGDSSTTRISRFHTRGALPPLAFPVFTRAGLFHCSHFPFSHARDSSTARVFRFHTRGTLPPLAFPVFTRAGLFLRLHFPFSHARVNLLKWFSQLNPNPNPNAVGFRLGENLPGSWAKQPPIASY
jgi:hypothetical protein